MQTNSRRFLSWGLDTLVAVILIMVATGIEADLLRRMMLAWGVGYMFFRDAVGGASVGKRLVGIRVVGPNDEAVGLVAAVLRNFILLIPLLGWTDGLRMLFSANGQRYSDQFLGFRVVMKQGAPVPLLELGLILFLPVILSLAYQFSQRQTPEPRPVEKWEPQTPLERLNYAITFTPEKVKGILPEVKDVNVLSDTKSTPLQLAVATGNLEVLEMLLERGADICQRTNLLKAGGQTVEEIAVQVMNTPALLADARSTKEEMKRILEGVRSQKCGGKFDQAAFKKATAKTP